MLCSTAWRACASVTAPSRASGVDAETTDPRVLAALKAVIVVSGFRTRVTVCELSLPYLNATVENFGSYYSIGVTKMLIKQSTNVELRAVLGHEIAHIVLGHRIARFELRHRRTARDEEAADALSARWFGKAAMLSVLKKVRADAKKLSQVALKRQAIIELDARINALR
jgi:predicted Zn-dependent protease